MKATILLFVLAGCPPPVTRAGVEDPAHPDAPVGRVAGPPPAFEPSAFEPPPPPQPPAKQPPAKEPPKQPPAHDHHGHH